MTRPNLTNAETLCWIARVGTFREAAERMFTTQPAVSARMRELEASLGFSLFERHGRRLRLTMGARRFVEKVEPLIQAMEKAFSDDDTFTASAATVRIGLGEISMTWFAGLIPMLRKSLPRVSFELELHLALELRQRLEDGRMDIAIVAGQLDDPRFVTQTIGHTRMVWLASSSLVYDGQGRRRSQEDLLQNHAIWVIARPSNFFPAAQRMLRDAGANLENMCTCNRLGGLIDIVERGGGIGQLPEMMVADRIADGRLVSLAPALPPLGFNFTMSRNRDQDRPVIKHIMETAIQMSLSSKMAPPYVGDVDSGGDGP